MQVEIDQSGKLEQLNTDTVVAYANGKSGAVVLKAGVKRRIVNNLRRHRIPEKDVEAIWFAVVIFLLIKALPKTVSLVIDEEYTGKSRVIEETLTKLLQQRFNGRWQGIVRFRRIGKASPPAHRLAWRVHRAKQRSKAQQLGEQEVLRFLK